MLRAAALALAFFVAGACTERIKLPGADLLSGPRDDEGRLVVGVTADGDVLFDGTNRTLDELDAILQAEPGTPVVLHVDPDARWLHVLWVLWIAHDHDPAFAVERAGQAATFRMANRAPLPGDWWDIDGPTFATVDVRVDPERTEDSAVAAPYCGIYASTTTRAADVLEAFEALRVAEQPHVFWGESRPHGWVRAQPRLPAPRREEIQLWWRRGYIDRFPSVLLPLALLAAEDKNTDPHHRLILTLDARGFVVLRGHAAADEELRSFLSKRIEQYDFKRRRGGQRGLAETAPDRWASHLYVLLRADKDLPWRHVRRVLNVVGNAGIFKIQFGAAKSANIAYPPDEARVAGVRRYALIPSSPDGFEAKLSCFLSTDLEIDRLPHIEVAVDSAGVYSFANRATRDRDVLVRWLVAERKTFVDRQIKILGRIDAPDDTPWKTVIATLDAFAIAALEKVDFVGVNPCGDAGSPR